MLVDIMEPIPEGDEESSEPEISISNQFLRNSRTVRDDENRADWSGGAVPRRFGIR